jgi:chromosome segregation ATPase
MKRLYDSLAAVHAMGALQDKVKELESENGELRHQVAELRALAEERDSQNAQRDRELTHEAENTQKMLESASETLIELRRIRLENRGLEDELRKLRTRLEAKRQSRSKEREMIEFSMSELKHTESLEVELEDLFALLLSPPEFQFDRRMNVVFNQTIASVTTHSLHATLQTVLNYIQQMRTPFRSQKLAVKREIVQAMVQAKGICCKLIGEIDRLETSKLGIGARKRVQGDIASKTADLYLLSQAMSRFSFT